jgi:hypothetical protein
MKYQSLGAYRPDLAVPRVNGFISVLRKFRALIASVARRYCLLRPSADTVFIRNNARFAAPAVHPRHGTQRRRILRFSDW